MEQNETKWNKVEQNGTERNRMTRRGTKRSFVKNQDVSMRVRDHFGEAPRCMRILYHEIVTIKRHLMNMASDGQLFRFSRTAPRSRDVQARSVLR